MIYRASVAFFALLPFLSSSAFSAAEVVYSEAFTNTAPSGNRAVSLAGWSAYVGAGATNLSNTVPVTSANLAGLSTTEGTDLPATPGYLFTAPAPNTTTLFAAVETFAAINAYRVSWKMGNMDPSISVRMLIQQEGNWYASSTTYTTATVATAADFKTKSEMKTLVISTAGENWRALTLTPGTALSLSAGSLSAALPSSTISGIGFLIHHGSAFNPAKVSRIDDLVISGPPADPAAAPYASRLMNNLQAGRSQTVVAYGTSLTAIGPWVADTAHWLNGLYPGQVTMINSGMGGMGSNTGVANLASKVIAKAPDTVFIEFAINDANIAYGSGDTDYGITVAKSKANLNHMIDAIREARPDTEIILQTMNQGWDVPGGNQSESRRPDLALYYEGYRQVAAERGLLLIDHYVNWRQLQADDLALFKTYVPDGVHPVAAGSAGVTMPELKKRLLAPVSTVTLSASAPSANELGVVAGGFTVARQSVSIIEPLTVYYMLGGTASNGIDFVSLPGAVTIPAGATTALITVVPLSDTLIEGDETLHLTLSANAAYQLTASATAQLTLHDRPADAWRFSQFTANERLDPAISGNFADPDEDGLVNLMEYALARNPHASEPASLTTAVLDGHLTLTFPRRAAPTDLSYVPEVSGNLESGWSSGPEVIEETVVGDLGDGVSLMRARDRTTLHATSQRFLRLRVSLP